MVEHFRHLPMHLREFLLHYTPFGSFLWIPAIHGHYLLFRALAERWQHETHTFHFPYREMTMLPQHLVLLTGLCFEGEPMVGKTAQGFAMVPGLLGRVLPKNNHSECSFQLSWLHNWTEVWPEPAIGLVQSHFVLRHFLLELIYLISCDASGYCVHADWLIYLADLDRLDMYDWGRASYAWLLCGLDGVIQQRRHSYIGLYPLLTVSL